MRCGNKLTVMSYYSHEMLVSPLCMSAYKVADIMSWCCGRYNINSAATLERLIISSNNILNGLIGLSTKSVLVESPVGLSTGRNSNWTFYR